jgi:hypothetical protein
MREMGISKQSLYDTFGDKRSIYFRAMSRYRDDINASLRKLFVREKSGRTAVINPDVWIAAGARYHDSQRTSSHRRVSAWDSERCRQQAVRRICVYC